MHAGETMHCTPCYKKRIKNGCPCIMEIRGMHGCALATSLYGSCRVSDQGTTLRASDLHNVLATSLNPFNF